MAGPKAYGARDEGALYGQLRTIPSERTTVLVACVSMVLLERPSSIPVEGRGDNDNDVDDKQLQ
jgi:hypothetical protein